MENPGYCIPYLDKHTDQKLKLFNISIRGERFQIYDLEHSETPKWVERDMNQDCYGMADLLSLETIVDIGANTGIFSLYVSRLFPDATIYAYEPFPLNYSNLVKNIELNQAKNIVPIQMAVTGKGQNISLACPSNNSGSASFFHGIHLIERKTHSVTLNQLVEKTPKPIDLLKIDIESMEYEVLWCFEKWPHIKNLSVELHGLFPYPKLLWDQTIRSFQAWLREQPIQGRLWTNDVGKL